jgi:hypothetical protein
LIVRTGLAYGDISNVIVEEGNLYVRVQDDLLVKTEDQSIVQSFGGRFYIEIEAEITGPSGGCCFDHDLLLSSTFESGAEFRHIFASAFGQWS